jgi:hypothetical protein
LENNTIKDKRVENNMPDVKTLGAKVGQLGLGHLLVAGASAVAVDKFEHNLFGMGDLVTGLIKVGEGVGISYLADGHSYGKAVAIGVGVNGIMDIVNSFLAPHNNNANNMVI